MSFNDTPRGEKLVIGFYGKRNSGKSSLINALSGQEVAIVSGVPGTTTDPVNKSMEIYGLGPCLLVDTPGFDDIGELGAKRVDKTKLVFEKTNIGVLLFSSLDIEAELEWYQSFKKAGIPVLCVVSKADVVESSEIADLVRANTDSLPVIVSVFDQDSILCFKDALIRLLPEDYGVASIVGSLVKVGDVVLLVMPQDIQAPKGRLILPQVQTIRDLLDHKCIVVCVTTDRLVEALASLVNAPELIITDSQVFKDVFEHKPKGSLLTSFSVLFAAYKGDLAYYIEGARAIDSLTAKSKVLIAECCAHAPLEEDIGREKIPALLRKKVGSGLSVEVVSGMDFPVDLSGYDLIIQCGGCMFNRKYVLSRIDRARGQGVAMSNYGVVIAYLNGILGDISY